MNEMVTSERGVLVTAQPVGTQGLATLYGFHADDMEYALERCATMSENEAAILGLAARAWYESENRAFPIRLQEALSVAPSSKALK
jgi:hypothetical protein